MIGKVSTLLALTTALLASAAQADVVISEKPTQNMSCNSGICTPTAQKATLNVTDLANMLASGDVTVNTGGSLAKDIDISAALSWAGTSRLTLDAYRSLTVKKPVSVTGSGALTITTNDGSSGGDLLFEHKGNVTFWDLNSSLIIDGNSYTLVGDIATLAADIAANPSGFYALAKSYDASADGTYASSPIQAIFRGEFNGLGNVISNLKIKFAANQNGVLVGLFQQIGTTGVVRSVGCDAADLEGTSTTGTYGAIGVLVGYNQGLIDGSWTSGLITIPGGENALPGGLAGGNDGAITNSYSATRVGTLGLGHVGGLTSYNRGMLARSYTTGSVAGAAGLSDPGGLVGYNSGLISNAFAMAAVHEKRGCCGSGYFGGLVGDNDTTGQVISSYAAGKIGQTKRSDARGGGLIGFDASVSGAIAFSYWDIDKGIGDPSQGAGNIKDDPGITGLTTEEFISALPKGFDPKIWGINPNINGGFPYLLANPPKD